MGTRLARGSDFRSVFFNSAFFGSVFPAAVPERADTTGSTGPTLISETGGGVFVGNAESLTPLLFLGNFGFVIVGYSLHAPKFRNYWIWLLMNNIHVAPASSITINFA